MNVKGTAVKSTQNYVKKYFGTRYAEWLKSMPSSSSSYMSGMIQVTDWYPIMDAFIEPIKSIGKLFFDGDEEKAAIESGRFSAEDALGGVYKVFIRLATPKFMVERSAKIFTVYFDPSEVTVNDAGEKFVHITITTMPIIHPLLELRIGSWVQKALEVTGRKSVRIEIPLSHCRGDSVTEMYFRWE